MANSLTVWSTASDGRLTGTSTDYATARSTATAADTTASTMSFGSQYYSSPNFNCYEAFFSFDTSSLGSSATVTAATFSLWGTSDQSTQDYTLEARISDWGASLTTGDWVAGDSLGDKTLVATKETSGYNSSGYNAFVSETAFLTNIATTGTTYILCNSSRHRLNNQPSATREDVAGSYADDSTAPGGTGHDPKLYVEYTSPGVRLIVPVELVDAAFASTATSDTEFERHGCWLDPSDFDGTCTFYFEANVQAISSPDASMDIQLYDTTNNQVAATVTATTGMTSTTRVRSSSFSPTSGTNRYSIITKGSQLTTGGYTVYSARLIIKQVDATKTSIPVPLAQYGYSNTASTTLALATHTATSWDDLSSPQYQGWWLRDDDAWATVSGYRLEAMGWTGSGSCSLEVALYNRTDNAIVTNSIASTTSTTPTCFYTDFTSDTNFHDGDVYSLRFQSETGSTVYPQGGRLWVKLTNVTKGEVYFRILTYRTSSSIWTASTGRACLELNSYSNPTLYHEAESYTSHTSSEDVLSWQDCDTSDSASGTENSQFRITSPTTSRSISRGSAITALVNNDRIIHNKLTSTGTLYNYRSFAVIAFSFTGVSASNRSSLLQFGIA